MIRYYCSGFDVCNPFGHGLGTMFKSELEHTNNIVYIPGGMDKIEKAQTKHIPFFTKHFRDTGIEFQKSHLITPEFTEFQAKDIISNADFIMFMGGDPFKQKELCEDLNITDELRQHKGIMLGYSAGAMLMSKYIIITPCSEEYPDFRIEKGLNLDDISIYPHNNTSLKEYPDELTAGDEVYKKKDLMKVANEYGKFYLLQDNLRDNGTTDMSIIKSSEGKIEFYRENDGKIWEVNKNNIKFLS